MVLSFVFISLSIFMLMLGKQYSKVFVANTIIECRALDDNWLIDQKVMSFFKIAMQMLLRLNFQSIVLMQIYEWYAMLYLIET